MSKKQWEIGEIEHYNSRTSVCINGPRGKVCKTDDSDPEIAMSDARLVAAAPELLILLDRITTFLADLNDKNLKPEEVELERRSMELFNEGEALIAKVDQNESKE